MTDTLASIAQAIHTLELDGMQADPAGVHAVARRLDAFAEAEPRLDPGSRLNLLTRLARMITPRCPRDLDAARSVLGLGEAPVT